MLYEIGMKKYLIFFLSSNVESLIIEDAKSLQRMHVTGTNFFKISESSSN